jgi:phosphatidylserine/phosphatidylglycerophosphate/cardiolipin synthase-like enzyme
VDDYPTSRDFAVITSDASDVAAIETVFENDFVNGSANPPLGDDLVWSPTNSKSEILGVINGATASLLVENEEMSEGTVVAALAGAAARGVAVAIAIEASSQYESEFVTLVSAGAKLVTYRQGPLYIHAKVIIADYGAAGARAFVGSENFSYASLAENRELGLVLTDATVLEGLHATLAHDVSGGTPFQLPDAGAPVIDAAIPLDATASIDAAANDAGADAAGSLDAGLSD